MPGLKGLESSSHRSASLANSNVTHLVAPRARLVDCVRLCQVLASAAASIKSQAAVQFLAMWSCPRVQLPFQGGDERARNNPLHLFVALIYHYHGMAMEESDMNAP